VTGTFETIQHAAAHLPRYLGSDAYSSTLAQRFQDGLDSYKVYLQNSGESLESAAKGLYELFIDGGELKRMLMEQEVELIPGSKNIDFYICTAEVREKLVNAGKLNLFLDEFKAPSAKSKKNGSSTARNSGTAQSGTRRPDFRYSDIFQYSQHQQRSTLASWKSEPLVEDDGDHADLDAVMRRGLLEKCLYTPDGELTYDDFYTQKIESNRDTVIALRGGLGVGKTQLTQYIVLKKIAAKEDNVILFIGQRSCSAATEGRQLLREFKSQKFKPGKKISGKFYIIIDEPSADRLRWNKSDWEKLYNAARHYQSKIILLVRDHSSDEDLLQYFHVGSENIVQLQEAPKPIPLPENAEQWIDHQKLPAPLLDELRRLPLFRLPIDNRLWRLSHQKLSSNETLTSCFRSAYALIDHLYTNRLRDKEVHTGANRKVQHDEMFYQQCDELLQYVAFKLCQNNQSVSWTEGAPDQLPIWDSLICDGFINNIIKIEPRKGQQSQSVIKGFYHSPFYNYFLVREVRDRLVGNRQLEEVLSLITDRTDDMIKYNMLADGLCALANDHKSSAIQNLKDFKAENKKFAKSSYKETILTLIDLLNP